MQIEEIILRHSHRGMDILKEYLAPDFCAAAAKKLYSLERGSVLLTTGFYVAGYAETDGPPGTFFLARALEELGFNPVILTDSFCRGFFDGGTTETVYLERNLNPEKILEKYNPVALISIERCGENVNGDYANMRGKSIAEFTADIDKVFDLALEKGIYTIGVGDGGNEIGMGNLKDVIENKLDLTPCRNRVTALIAATISNWGAYGLAAELSILEKRNVFAPYEEIYSYLEYIVSKGSVDGVKGEHVPTVDGYETAIEKEIIDAINDSVNSALHTA